MKWFVCLTTVVLLLSVVALAQAIQTSSKVIGPCWVVDVKDGDTFKARLPDKSVIDVRYMAISAPEPDNELWLGPEAKEKNKEVLMEGSIWLEVEETDTGFLTDRDGRVLAHVFLKETATLPVQAELIREGLAMLDLRGLVDRSLLPGAFPIRYVNQLIDDQITAVSERRGLWGLPHFSPNRDLVIAVIEFWGYQEAVYLVNRGTTPIDLAEDWVLRDRGALENEDARNIFHFAGYLGPSCILPAGGQLRIYSGPDTPEKKRGTCSGCGTESVEVWWFGYHVWDNTSDEAFLFAPDGQQYFHYAYPPLKDLDEEG